MKETRLVELLKTFSNDEMNELEKFIASPFFSKSRDVMPIFKAIKVYYPDFSSEKFTKENIFDMLFPGKKFDDRADSHMRTLVSQLFRLCKNLPGI